MSAAGLSITVTITGADLASRRLADLLWLLWWSMWGTDGDKRRRALVVLS